MSENQFRVLGFDNWTKGIHHFARLKPALESLGIEFSVVHLGSWGNEPGRPTRELLHGVDVSDIAAFGGDLEAMLDAVKPDVVLFLSTQTFSHRALIRYCGQRSIPTLHLYHGFVSVQASSGSKRIDRAAYLRFVLSKLPRVLSRVLPCYIRSLVRTGASRQEWARMVSDTVRLAVGKANPIASADSLTTRCAVFAQPDVEHAVRTFGFLREDVVTVGLPDLLRFGVADRLLGSRLSPGAKRGGILYIGSGLLVQGRVFAGETGRHGFVTHMVAIARQLQTLGYRLWLKPHPSVDRELLEELRTAADIVPVSDFDFVAALEMCDACLVEATSLAVIPALLGMPLLLANFGALGGLAFGPVLIGYPRASWLTDLANVDTLLLEDVKRLDHAAALSWIATCAGPLPAREMPQRVATELASLCRRSSIQNQTREESSI